MGDSTESVWTTLAKLIKDYGAMAAGAARRGAELSADLVKRYASMLLWLFKVRKPTRA